MRLPGRSRAYIGLYEMGSNHRPLVFEEAIRDSTGSPDVGLART